MAIVRTAIATLVFCFFFFSLPAAAAVVTIDFEADAQGAKANGFTPTGISDITFSDSNGADLGVFNVGPQGSGERSLLVGTELDGSVLQIALDYTADFLSLDFGNDDPNATNVGDLAVLKGFLGTTMVEMETVVLNRDDLMNQTISLGAIGGGVLFDNFSFAYTDPLLSALTGGGAALIGLTEVVDNIRINSAVAVIPLPGAFWLFLPGLVGLLIMQPYRRSSG